MTAVTCNPQLELSSSCCSEQVVQVHQGGISTNLLGDKEQKNLHPEWNENPTEDYTELIMGCPSLVPKAILENSVEGTGILPEGHLSCVSWNSWSVRWASGEQKNSRNRQLFSSWVGVGKRPRCTCHPTVPCAGFFRKKTWVPVWGGSQSTFQQIPWLRWLAPNLNTSVDNQLRRSKGSSIFNITLVLY